MSIRKDGSDDYIARITKFAIRHLEHLQPWPYQFRRRALEVRSLSRLHNLSAAGRVLEIGCGNAFGSALLSQGRKQVVATDLAMEDLRKHTIGLQKARSLLDQLDLGWCEVIAASAGSLPFDGRSFDMVFSLFVLEHVLDRDTCLKETYRLLDDDGLVVTAVPGSMWTITAIPRFYLYLVQRLLARAVSSSRDGTSLGFWRLFRTRYPHFPFPNPHGAYRNYFQELTRQSRGYWVDLFQRNRFDVLECRPIMVLPLCMLQMLLGELGLDLYERLFKFDQWLADRRFLRSYGQFFGIVARKRR